MKTAPRDPFFIGWSGEMQPRDRRTFLLAAMGLIAGGAGAAYGLGRFQAGAGHGQWDMGRTLSLTGDLLREPYPILRVAMPDGSARHIYLVTNTKCGGQDRIAALASERASITGTPLIRGQHGMLAIADDEDAVRAAEGASRATTEVELFGEISSPAVILDAKCFLGAMRPNEHKIHKACAALCIRGGIPPLIHLADQPRERRLALLVDEKGAAHSDALLPFVADPLRATGRLMSVGGLLTFRASVAGFARLG